MVEGSRGMRAPSSSSTWALMISLVAVGGCERSTVGLALDGEAAPVDGDAAAARGDGAIDAAPSTDAGAARGADGGGADGGRGLDPARGLPVDRCVGGHVPDRSFDGEVALTFDDGPVEATTPQVIETLRRHGAPATFFIQGNMVDGPEARALLDELVADPAFIVANHSMTHARLGELAPDAAEAEIDAVEAILRAHGEAHRFFRFPYASATCETMRMVRERGLSPVGVQVDGADFCYGGGEYGVCEWDRIPPEHHSHGMIAWVLEQLAALDGGVVLLHDSQPYTAEHLDALLTAIEDAGYRFVALDDVAIFPRLNERRFVGDACRDDGDCPFDPRARCHAAGFCTLPCEGACPTREGWAPTFCGAIGGAGICLGVPSPLNRDCMDVPGTAHEAVRRFGADAPEHRVVCAPSS